MELRPGLLVGKNVRLVRLLGQGGMGSVWVADHLTLQIEVAVKFIAGTLAEDAVALQRFTSEATASAQIKSPHIVQIFDHGVFDSLPYIVMELLAGEELEARIVRSGNLSLEETALIVKQATKALSQAHAHGIVHRDIKPANIFLTESDGEIFVKLLDFGIAKRVTGDNHAKTATGMMVGTPYYMSPEMVMDDREIDIYADLWALSVVVYECLTGKLPFDGASLGAIYVSINSCSYRPATEANPTLPAEVDRWFTKAFARKPEERFGSARELATTLLELCRGMQAWDAMTVQTGRASSLPSIPLAMLNSMPASSSSSPPHHTPVSSSSMLSNSAVAMSAVPTYVPAPVLPASMAGALRGSAAPVAAAPTWNRNKTDPMPPVLPTMELPYAGGRSAVNASPKETLGGTTTIEGDTSRRRRLRVVALAGIFTGAFAVIAVVVTLTRSPEATMQGDASAGRPLSEAASAPTAHPAPAGPDVVPATDVAETAGAAGVASAASSAEDKPPPAVEDTPPPVGTAANHEAVNSAPKATSAPKTITTSKAQSPPKVQKPLPTTGPKRRDHGF